MVKPSDKLQKTSKSTVKESGTRALTDGYSMAQGLNYDFDPYLILDYAKKDPVIRAAINKTAKRVMTGGWNVEPILDMPEAEQQAKQFEEFAKTAGGGLMGTDEQIDFDGVLFNMLLSLMEGDEIYLEVRDNLLEVPGELHVMDWEDMRIKLKKSEDGKYHGEIESYLQLQDGQIKTTFEPEEIIHRNMYAHGTRLYGCSLIRSIMMQAAGRMYATKYANNIFVNQKPKGIWSLDLADKEYKKVKGEIKEGKMNPWQDIVLQVKGDKVSYKSIDFGTEMAYKDFIKDNRIEILVGIGVPSGAVYLPGETSGWGADVENSEFDEDINFIRTYIEGIVNNILFPRFGFDAIKFRFNRSNKRDEEREAKIVEILSDILTINERREMIGKQAMEGGDIVVPKPKSIPRSPEGERSHEELDQTEMEGIGQERELSRMNTNFKFKNYFKKSFGEGNHLFSKSIAKRKPSPITHKNPKKLEALEKGYFNALNTLLRQYVDRIVEVTKDMGGNFFLGKSRLKKIANPTREIAELEAIRREFVGRSRDLSVQFTNIAWDQGVDTAQIELGVPLSKVAIAGETLDFLQNMNIDVVEGAYSELAQRSKTQIRLGLLEGESIPQITKRLEGIKGSVELVYKNRMRTIARTETGRALWHGSIEAYKNSNVVDQVQVIIGTGPDDAAICESTYQGPAGGLSKVFKINEVPERPHPNCKCVVIPVVK